VLLGATAVVTPDDLAPALASVASTSPASASAAFAPPVLPLQEVNRRYARWAVDHLDGRRVATADALEIDRKTLAKLLGDLGKG
jgi:hypothetical protein